MEDYTKTIQGPGQKRTVKPKTCCRLAAEREWVQALLQICGRKMHPFFLRRWLSKYEEDCRLLGNRSGGWGA